MSEKQVPDVQYKGNGEQKGFFVSYTQLAIAVVVVIAITVAVGLIAGLTGNAGSGSQASTGGTTVATTMATTKAAATTKATVASTTKGPTVKPTTPAPPKYPALAKARLPTDIKPSEYYFELDVDMTTLSYTGINVINFTVVNPTNIIVVHIDGITVTGTPQVSTDRYFSTGLQNVIDQGSYAKNNYYYTVLQSNLQAGGVYYVRYTYNAKLSSDRSGFYKYQYTRASDRATVWAAASQLEDFYARRVLPCFDEPAMKATFQANITVPSNYSALWNTMRTGVTMMGDKKRFEFSTKTPVMSTYLMAFTVDDFVNVNGTTNRNTMVRVFSRPGIKQYSNYALGAAINITEYFESLFGLNYQMGKQDHVAVPVFAAGAMENWGLILYREELLSYDPYYINSNGLESIVTVISHELAHMWFGNLATLQWWNHLWLNEAFANFFQNFGAAPYEPGLFLMQQFVLDSVQSGLSTDSSPTSHPIVPPSAYGPFFDRITYQKGGSVLRMFRDYLGHDNFFTGLRGYLNDYSYSNADTVQLFASLTKAVAQNPFNISEFLGPWVYQMGYPVVNVTRDTQNNQGVMTQQRYLNNKDANPSQEGTGSPYVSPYQYKWTIPVNYYDQASSNVRRVVFGMNDAQAVVPWPANSWIKLNANQMGFYRVMYPIDNWNRLATALQSNLNVLLNTDRANLLDDAFTFALTKRLDITVPLSLTKYMSNEVDHLPWTVVSNNFFNFRLRLSNRQSFQHFVKYNLKISGPPADRLQFLDTGGFMEKSARYTVLNTACGAGYVPCINNASAILAKYMMNKVANNVPATYRTIVFRYGIAYGGVAEWDALYNEMRQSLDITDRGRILNALSYARQPWILRRFLNYSMDPTKISASSTFTVFTFVSRNPVGRYLAWDYFRENQAFIKQRYGSTRTLLSIVTQYFNDQFRLDEVRKYIAAYPETTLAAKATENGIIARIQNNMRYLTDFESKMSTWFSQN
ncbi:uncharacterized protein TRIADDRAFT_63982 [Trichoplax adhaerens]|uniref:Aminopeptidase n=1 Tax=Trichoplax adhaerens TaxID=10228 RepID=B3S0G5_TRIAD|nr:hypothetical protein TRIADDRAFT_63982 [Trichoplax adhaerens]EDV23634.1 hypothetical protein TRIADDRAFT_63982 [Trichoplax adhaerens]|eukprot:XP_002113160.1 hypothetical protein TRIADDRAFT_63982 [Trichoplax adhaerens]